MIGQPQGQTLHIKIVCNVKMMAIAKVLIKVSSEGNLSRLYHAYPDSAPTGSPGLNTGTSVVVADSDGLDAVGVLDRRGGEQQTDVVLDGLGHVVLVGGVAGQAEGDSTLVPAVGTDGHTERAVKIYFSVRCRRSNWRFFLYRLPDKVLQMIW